MAEGRGERATGTPNTIYDLSSVLFHALEGGASYDKYIRDAEEAGDEELATFFIEVRDEDSMRADEAQRLLAERTPAAQLAFVQSAGATRHRAAEAAYLCDLRIAHHLTSVRYFVDARTICLGSGNLRYSLSAQWRIRWWAIAPLGGMKTPPG